MITAEQFKKASAVLRNSKDTLSDDDYAHLSDVVKQYDKEQSAPATEKAPSFGVEGPTGMDMLERRLGPAPRDEEGIKPDAAASPMGKALAGPLRGFDDAVRLNRVTSDINETLPNTIESDAEKKRRQFEYEQARNANHDPKLPSASGQKDLYRPPEFIPQGLGIAGALPDFVGGGVKHFVEPGVSQFQRDMRPVYGDAVDGWGPGTPEYQAYADAKWKEIYDQAQAKGFPVVRVDYANHPEWREKTMGKKNRDPSLASQLYNLGLQGIGELFANTTGYANAMTLGGAGRALGKIDKAIDPNADEKNDEKLASAYPLASGIGAGMGAMNPYGAGGLLSSGAGKMIGPLADIPMLGAAIKGGVGAGGTVLGEEGVARAAGDAPSGDVLKRAENAGLLGAGLGAGFDLLGMGFGATGKNLRERNPDIGKAEDVGGHTSSNPFETFTPGPKYKELLAEQAEDNIAPVPRLTRDLANDLTNQGRTLEETAVKQVGRAKDEYHALTQDVQEPATEPLNEAMRLHSMRSNMDGSPIGAWKNGELREFIRNTSNVTAVRGDAFAALKNAQAVDPGSRIVDATEAARMGIDTKFAIRNWAHQNGVHMDDVQAVRPNAPPSVDAMGLEESGDRMAGTNAATPRAQLQPQRPDSVDPASASGFKFIVKPKPYNPAEYDSLLASLRHNAEVGDNRQPDPIWGNLLEKAYAVRDRFPAVGPAAGKSYTLTNGQTVRGYSALEQEHADLLQKANDSLAAVGLQGTPGPRPSFKTKQGVANAVERVVTGGDRVPAEYTSGVQEMAAQAGKTGALNEARNIAATERLMHKATPVEMMGIYKGRPYESFKISGGRMAIDPMLSTLGLPSGERVFEKGTRPDIGNLTNPFRLRGGAPGRAASATERRPGDKTMTPEEAQMLRGILTGVY